MVTNGWRLMVTRTTQIWGMGRERRRRAIRTPIFLCRMCFPRFFPPSRRSTGSLFASHHIVDERSPVMAYCLEPFAGFVRHNLSMRTLFREHLWENDLPMRKFLAGLVVVGLGFAGTSLTARCSVEQNRPGCAPGCRNARDQRSHGHARTRRFRTRSPRRRPASLSCPA